METFRVAGPAAAHVDMEHGLSLIGTYAEKLDYFEAQRLDLSEFIVVWVGGQRVMRPVVDCSRITFNIIAFLSPNVHSPR